MTMVKSKLQSYTGFYKYFGAAIAGDSMVDINVGRCGSEK